MDRRKFLKLGAFLPLIFWGRDVAASKESGFAPDGKKIVLLETTIAGWQYHEGDSVWNKLQPEAPLTLHREPDNPYDGRAIAVYADSVKLGYIPKTDNTVIAGMIDQNVPLQANVLRKNSSPHPWEKMEIRVTMETN